MREIKFRGISYLTNDWVYGYLSKRESLYYIQNTYNVKENTIGQFTGLKDKNGVEIYEGDITYHHAHKIKCEIVWLTKFMTFAGQNIDKTDSNNHYFYQFIDCNNLEVLGNIYEHPNLLNNE